MWSISDWTSWWGALWGNVWTWLFVAFVALFGLAGCSIIDTGPSVARAAVEGATGTAKTLIAQYQPDSLMADAQASVNDPRYRVQMFVGAGTYVDTIISLEGADVSFDVQSAGHGVEIPAEMKAELASILGNHMLSEEERQSAIVDAVLRWAFTRDEQAEQALEESGK